MKKITKNLLISQLSILTATSIIVPTIALSIRENKKYQYVESSTDSVNTYDGSKLIFDNRVFNTKQELMAYANESLIQESINSNTPTSYLIKNDPKYSEVFGVVGINNFLDEKIKKHEIKLSKELETDMIGSIINNDLKFIHDPNENNEVMIYRGRNNSVYLSEEEAKKSYIEVHEVYKYKDIYFPTKQSLGNYLQQNTDQWYGVGEPSGFVLVAPNGQESNVIEVDKINEVATIQYIKNFVKVHCDENMAYLQNNAGTTSMVYYNDKTYTQSKFAIDYDPNYVYVSSNGGKGKYVIDTVKSDEAELKGPYYVTSSSSMEDVTNKSFWGETQNTDIEKTDRYRNLQIVSSFFDSIITSEVPDNIDAANKFFYIDEPDFANVVEKFFQSIKDNFYSLYSKLQTTYDNLKRGERYSTFYKIPLFYLMIIDGLVNKGAKQYFIDNAIEAFEKICEYCDNKLQSTISNRLLLKRNKNGTRSSQVFSFKEFFQIGNKMLDLNYDIQADVTKMINEYPDILKVSKIYPTMTAIKSKVGSTYKLPFNRDFFNRNFDLDIKEDESFWYEIMWNSICTDDFVQLTTAASLMNITRDDLSDYNPMEIKGISRVYLSNFFDEWSKTIIINEAIRYSLTRDKWIYSDEQVNFLDSLGFMRLTDSESRTMYNSFYNQKLNLEYMKELYKKNNGVIENIFFIIMSMANQKGQLCRNLFGEPKTYNDDLYSKKVYDYFYNNILNDFDNFDKLSSEIFTIDLLSLTSFSDSFGFSVQFENKDKDDNKDYLYVDTVSKYPSIYRDENINLNTTIKKVQIDGRPKILFVPNKTKEDTSTNINKKQMMIADPTVYGNIYNQIKSNNKTRDLGQNLNSLVNTMNLYRDRMREVAREYRNKANELGQMIDNFANYVARIPDGPMREGMKVLLEGLRAQQFTLSQNYIHINETRIHQLSNDEYIRRALLDIDGELRNNRERLEEVEQRLRDLDGEIDGKDNALREELRAQYTAEIDAINNNIRDLEVKYDNELQTIDRKLNDKIQDQNRNLRDVLDNIDAVYDRRLNDLQASMNNNVAEINERYNGRINDLREQIDNLPPGNELQINILNQQILEINQEWNVQINVVNQNNAAAAAELVNQRNDLRQRANNDHNNRVQNLRQDAIDDRAEIRRRRDDEINGHMRDRDDIGRNARRDYDDQIANIRREHRADFDALNNDVQSMKRKNPLRTKWREGFAKFMEVVQVIGTALSYLEMVFMVFDMITNFKKTVKVSYSYVSNDFSLIWDGGYRTSWFYGMIPGDSKGLEAIEIINPIEIVRPNKTTGYYYNGYIFSSPEEVKRVQMNDILKGTYKNKNIKTYYSFEKMNENGTGNKYYSEKIDDLCDMVYKDVKDYCDKLNNSNSTTNINKNDSSKKIEHPDFILPNSYSFYDNNKIYEIDTINKTPQENIDNILAKIQPCLIAYYPTLNKDGTNYPITKDQFKNDDGSAPEYVIPGKNFDLSTGTVKTNDIEESLYETYDMNRREKTKIWIDIGTARDRLYEKMSQKFNVYSKKVFENDIINVKYFSDFNNYTVPSQLYIAYGSYGQKKYFTNKTAAVNYIFASYDIEIFYDRKVKNVFIYNNELFESKQDYLNWILNNTKGI